jgi:hypothetical protein
MYKGRAAQYDMDPLEKRGGRWHVRIHGIGVPDPEAKSYDEGTARLRAVIRSGAADDLLHAAVLSGVVTNPAFLDILDGGLFERAACLCCYTTREGGAREARAALRLFQDYYNAMAYIRSRAYARSVATLSRDLQPEELDEVRAHLAHLDATPAPVREINRLGAAGGICVAAPLCRPGTLWVYSSPAGRRLLRHLSRSLTAVRVVVASSDPGVLPRFRYRMYAAWLAGDAGAGDAPRTTSDPDVLLLAAAAWVRERVSAARRLARTQPPERAEPQAAASREPRGRRPRPQAVEGVQ